MTRPPREVRLNSVVPMAWTAPDGSEFHGFNVRIPETRNGEGEHLRMPLGPEAIPDLLAAASHLSRQAGVTPAGIGNGHSLREAGNQGAITMHEEEDGTLIFVVWGGPELMKRVHLVNMTDADLPQPEPEAAEEPAVPEVWRMIPVPEPASDYFYIVSTVNAEDYAEGKQVAWPEAKAAEIVERLNREAGASTGGGT